MNFNLKKITISIISLCSILLTTNSFASTETVTLAGGCFWCTESDMEKYLENTDVISGFSGVILKTHHIN